MIGYKCSKCGFSTANRKVIRAHVREVHKIKCWKAEKRNSEKAKQPYKSLVSDAYERCVL